MEILQEQQLQWEDLEMVGATRFPRFSQDNGRDNVAQKETTEKKDRERRLTQLLGLLQQHRAAIRLALGT